MLVYAVAAAQTALYVLQTPLYLAFWACYDGWLHYGAGLSAFASAPALRRAALPERQTKRLKHRGSAGAFRARTALRLLRACRVRVEGRVCTGDAALTALACGGLNALAGALTGTGRNAVKPDFSDAAPRLELRVVARFTAGQLLLAATRAARFQNLPGMDRPGGGAESNSNASKERAA